MKKIALLGDVHGNIQSLNTVMQSIENHKIYSFIFCGDYVGYYYNPDAVISEIRKLKSYSVIGNHDKKLLDLKQEKSSNRSELLYKYYKEYGSGLEVALKTLGGENINWLTNLPKILNLKIENLNCTIFHGTPFSTEEYLYPDTPMSSFEIFMIGSDTKLFIGGHSHYQFLKRIGCKFYINPGSIGQSRDIRGKAAWAILTVNDCEFKVEFMRTAYNFHEVAIMAQKLDPHIPYLQDIFTRF